MQTNVSNLVKIDILFNHIILVYSIYISYINVTEMVTICAVGSFRQNYSTMS